MFAKNGNAFVKLVLVLALIGGGVFAVLFFVRETVAVVEVVRRDAPDAVPGSVLVFADHDLQELKSEMPGRVVWLEPLDPGATFKKGDVLLKLDPSDLERALAEAKRQLDV